MKFNKRLFRKALKILYVLIPLMFALRLVTYFSELDVATGFFKGNGAYCTLYNIIGFGVFFLCLALSFTKGGSSTGSNVSRTPNGEDLFVNKQEGYDAEEFYPQYFYQGFARKTVVWNGTLSAFCSFLPGFGFLAYAIAYLTNDTLSSDPYAVLFSVLSILSGAYFIYFSIRNSPELNRKQSFFALIPALWCTARLVVEYRDLARFVNKSLYIGQFLFLISVMLFFMYQAQLLLGEDALSRPNSYAFTAIPAVYFGITGRFTQLVAGLTDRIPLDLVDASALLIDLAITLYIILKIAAIAKSRRNS